MEQPKSSLPSINFRIIHNLDDAVSEQLNVAALRECCSGLARYWGVPGEAQVEIQCEPSSNLPLQLVIHDRLLIGSSSLMNELRSWLDGKTLSSFANNIDWIQRVLSLDGPVSNTYFLQIVLETWCHDSPSYLLSYAHFESFWRSLALPSTIEEGLYLDQWYRIFLDLLELGVSLAPKDQIKELIIESIEHVADNSNSDNYSKILEHLFSGLKGESPKLRIPYADFISLSTGLMMENPFRLVKDIVFNETGVIIPRIELVFDDSLGVNNYQMQMHDRLFPKRIMPLELSALEPREDRKALNPYTLRPVDNTFSVPKGLSSPLNYLALAVAGSIKSKAFLYVNRDMVKLQLEKIKANYPFLMQLVETSFLHESLFTTSLRVLQRQGLSIKRMVQLLEHALAAKAVKTDPKTNIIFADIYPDSKVASKEWQLEPRNLARYMRKQLRQEIQDQLIGRRRIPLAFKLGKEWVLYFAAKEEKKESVDIFRKQELISIFHKEMEVNGRPLVLVTYADVVDPITELIHFTFPDIPVVNMEELTDLKVNRVVTLN